MSGPNLATDALKSLSLSADALDYLAARLTAQASELRASVRNGDEFTARVRRYAALDTAQQIVSALKDPSEQWIDSLQGAALIVAVRMLQEWKAFDAIPTTSGSSISFQELADKVGAQMQLLRRFAWMLVTAGVLEYAGDERISHTERSLQYLQGRHGADFHRTLFDLAFRAYGFFPEYFAKYGAHEPETQEHVPVTYAQGVPELTFWGYLERHPDMIETFMRSIAPAAARMPITGIYDFGWVAEAAGDGDGDDEHDKRVLVNDVGGGTGHCIVAIQAENPAIPLGRFMLQDQYHIIDQLKRETPETLKGVRMAGLDFNKESPENGALIYHLRRILHDYSDSLAVNILRNTAAAMAPDSRLLIAEDVATTPPHPITAMMDLMIMTCGGKERTMQDFEALVHAAGLRVRSVSRSSETPLAIIECVLA